MFKVKCFLVLMLLLVMVQPGFSDETPVAPVQGYGNWFHMKLKYNRTGKKNFPWDITPPGM